MTLVDGDAGQNGAYGFRRRSDLVRRVVRVSVEVLLHDKCVAFGHENTVDVDVVSGVDLRDHLLQEIGIGIEAGRRSNRPAVIEGERRLNDVTRSGVRASGDETARRQDQRHKEGAR